MLCRGYAVGGYGFETPSRLKATALSLRVRYVTCEVSDRPLSVGRGATELRSRPRRLVAGWRLLFDNLLCRRRAGMNGTGCFPHDIRARAAPENDSPPIAGGPDVFHPASGSCLRSGTTRWRWRGSSVVFHGCAGSSRTDRSVVANVRSRPRAFLTSRDGEPLVGRRSGRSGEILAKHARMSCHDPEQRQCWSFGTTTPLLPVAQRVDADTQRIGELELRHPCESAQSDDVLPTFYLALGNPFTLPARYRSCKVTTRQFTDIVAHIFFAGTPSPIPTVYAIDLLSQGLTSEYRGSCAESSRSPQSVRFPFRNP